MSAVLRSPTSHKARSSAVRRTLSSRAAAAFVVVVTIVWTIPTGGLLITSLRPELEANTTGWWTWFTNPTVTLQNYHEILTSSDFGTTGGLVPYFVNSIVIALPTTIFSLAFAAMAGYALAWIRFKGSDVVFFTLFALQIVPLQLALVPLLQIFSQSHGPIPEVAGTYASLWIAHTIFAMPLATFLLHNFISQLPAEIIEAARVDGANHVLIFRKVVLRLITPALASFAIFEFLWVWNDLLVALTFAGGAKIQPITSRLAQLSGTMGSQLEILTAGAFIAIVVPLVVFFALQRYFVRGLLAGSVKG